MNTCKYCGKEHPSIGFVIPSCVDVKIEELESDATFWREMFVRAKCGCFAKDCAKHGSYDPNAVTKVNLILRYS